MSEQISKKLQYLEAFLIGDAVADDAMLLSDLDGFLAGIALSPESIEPSEWWPLIWGVEEPVFASDKEAASVVNLIMDHFEDVESKLTARHYQPIFIVESGGSLHWQSWIAGFWKAAKLRRAAWWQAYAASPDKDIREAHAILERLAEIAEWVGQEDRKSADKELIRFAPDVIAYHVEILRHGDHHVVAPPAQTIGRNDLCPCGSGKKYKKCCLNAATA